MKKWTLLLFLSTIIWSCDKEEAQVKVEDKIIGNWEFNHSEIGSTYQLPPMGGLTYVFSSDKTFIESNLGSSTWRNEGTWVYVDGSQKLDLTFKTYDFAGHASETKSLTLTVEKITDTELILKADYNKTNLSGEFVQFEFLHYQKK